MDNIKTVKEEVAEKDKNEGEYFKRVGLGEIRLSEDAQKYFHMSAESMRKLNRHECGEAAYFLVQESMYIQQQINKSKARIEWANGYIDRLVGGEITQVSRYVPKEFKRVLAIKNNDKAEALQQEVESHTYRINLINFLPTYLKSMSDVFLRLQDIKREK